MAVFHITPATIIALSDPQVGINPGGGVDAANVETKYRGDWNIWE